MQDNKIGVYHYNSCNSLSLVSALKKVSIQFEISGDLNKLTNFKKIIIPGIGNMSNFFNNNDNIEEYRKKIRDYLLKGGIVYGICLGMQVFLQKSEEGNSETLNLINGNSVALAKEFDLGMNVGFKKIQFDSKKNIFQNLFEGVSNNAKFYFLHKYHCLIEDKTVMKLYSDFEKKRIVSAIYKNNILGTQFHPELSGNDGLKFLKNFCEFNFNL